MDGACHCGAIRYEAQIDPRKVIICHCTDCQTVSGAPYRASVPVLAGKFVLHGTPKTYEKIAASGNKMVLAFCGDCGAALYSARRTIPASSISAWAR
ncbi:MAG TPA: GFA family protein [Rhizomicrobium sp.]